MARMRELTIAGTRIHDDGDCYVIAEIGHNHQGELERAKQLVDAAADAGVNAVKFQKRDNRRLFTRALFDQPYENENSFGTTYGEHREALELPADAWFELREHCRERGVAMFATAFDEASADFLADLDLPAFKIASGDLANTPLLRHVAAKGKPMILSLGGATLEDADRALEAVLPLNEQVCLLQCTASYPAEVEELNLRVIETLRERYPSLVIGLSDHHNGIAMSLVAYMLGARVIEKHFTLNHAWKGTDHAFSLMPDGMRKLVRDLRRVPAALGDGVKRPLPSEAGPLQKMGKKLVAARDLPAGHVLAAGDLVARSPGDGGLPPYELDGLLGRTLVRPLAEDEALAPDDVASSARSGSSGLGRTPAGVTAAAVAVAGGPSSAAIELSRAGHRRHARRPRTTSPPAMRDACRAAGVEVEAAPVRRRPRHRALAPGRLPPLPRDRRPVVRRGGLRRQRRRRVLRGTRAGDGHRAGGHGARRPPRDAEARAPHERSRTSRTTQLGAAVTEQLAVGLADVVACEAAMLDARAALECIRERRRAWRHPWLRSKRSNDRLHPAPPLAADDPLVSVVIPLYERHDLPAACLEIARAPELPAPRGRRRRRREHLAGRRRRSLRSSSSAAGRGRSASSGFPHGGLASARNGGLARCIRRARALPRRRRRRLRRPRHEDRPRAGCSRC